MERDVRMRKTGREKDRMRNKRGWKGISRIRKTGRESERMKIMRGRRWI